MRWRSVEFGHRPVEVHGDLLFYAGRDELLGVDVDTGEVRWRHDQLPSAQADGSPPRVRAQLLDEHGLVVVVGHWVRFHDPATGELQGEARLDGIDVSHRLVRVGAAVLVAGTDEQAAPSGDLVVALVEPEGQVRWRQPVDRVFTHLTAAQPVVLARIEGRLVALDPHDGRWRWQRAIGQGVVWAVRDERVLLVDHAAQLLQMLDVATGQSLYRTELDGRPAGGLRSAVMTDWLLLLDDGTVRLYDPVTDRTIDERPVALPRELFEGGVLERSDGVTVLWPGPPGGSDELVTYRSDGQVRSVVELPRPERGRCCPHLHDLGADDVRLIQGRVDDDGRLVRVVDVDTAAGTVVGLEEYASGGVEVHDGIIAVRREGHLDLHGPHGSITVRGASLIASTDPLVVHGGAGALRLDRGLLIDPDTS